ncbi:DMT family transporter [Brevibacillus borstelensis]|uniref:DMT family transporter n=1 Tax=Brevibacillus borstelensis TaxID=45462 RepID=UPI0030BE5F9A
MAYVFLGAAIVLEVFASTMLKLSNGFSRLIPSVGVIIGYGSAFYALSLALKALPLGLSYATWSGVGTILTVLVGVYLFKEKVNKQAIAGIAILIIGIVMLNLAK